MVSLPAFDLGFLLTLLRLVGLFLLFCRLLIRIGKSRKLLIDLCYYSFVCIIKLSKRLIRATINNSIDLIMLLLAKLALA